MKKIDDIPSQKIEKGYTLNHFLIFYLGVFICLAILVVVSEQFF
jgi:hypothetical protein